MSTNNKYFILHMYNFGQFDSKTMTKCGKCTDQNKTWTDTALFFEEVVNNIEIFKGNSGNATARHGHSNTNSAVEITEGVRVTVQE